MVEMHTGPTKIANAPALKPVHRLVRIFDILLSAAALVLALPIFLIAPPLIKLDSHGPVFYSHIRIGIDRRRKNRNVRSLTERCKTPHPQNVPIERGMHDCPPSDGVERRKQNLFGRPFLLYKFRTMMAGAEARSGPVWAIENDPRITRVGRILRKFHLDELPQLINILKGDMSLVGPRPERPVLIEMLIQNLPDYARRLEIKPGLTGAAQLCQNSDGSIDDVRRKLKLDLLLIEQFSLRLWLKILLLTPLKVLGNAPIRADHLFRLKENNRDERQHENPITEQPQENNPLCQA